MADTKTITSVEPFAIKVGNTKLPYGITRTTYTVDDNSNVTGTTAGKSPTVGYYVPVDKNTYDKISDKDADGFIESQVVPSGPNTTTTETKYYRRVAKLNDDAKFEKTPYTGADLQKEIANYNNGKPSQLSTVVRAANKSVAAEEKLPESKIDVRKSDTSKSAPPPPPPPDAATITTQSVAEAVQNASPINISIPSKGVRDDYGLPLYYPADLVDNKQDRIVFTMKRQEGSVINPRIDSNKKTIEKRTTKNIKGAVYLPIQPSISDNNTVDWSGGTLNAIQAFGAAASFKFITSSDTQQLGQNVGNILGKVSELLRGTGENPTAVQQAMRLYFAQEAVGAQGLLSRATGAILNPNLELLFNGPSLRPFGFTFKLSPRDATEATAVRKIIRFFKQGMSVKATESNVFLQSPNIFDIKYLSYDKQGNLITHPSINRIKSCALLSCDVDYTPDGTYMTFNDDARTMTSYQISLRFSELEPIYENDYNDPANKLTNDNIGY